MKNRILGRIGESFCTVRMEIFLGCIIQFYESISYFNTIVMCFISLNMWAKICVTPFRIVYIYLCTHKGGYKRFGRGLRKPFSNFFFSRYLGLIWSTYIAEKTQQHVRKSLSKPMKTRKVYIYLIPPYCMDEHLHECPLMRLSVIASLEKHCS